MIFSIKIIKIDTLDCRQVCVYKLSEQWTSVILTWSVFLSV